VSGQAAVAVVISLIQVISTALSLDDKLVERTEEEGRAAEENSASLFFFVTTLVMLVALLTHAYLVRMPIYRNVAAPFEAGNVIETEEEQGLMTHTVDSLREIEPVLPIDPREVAKSNMAYNLSIAFVFVVTLVREPTIIKVPVPIYTRGVVSSHHCSRTFRQSTFRFSTVKPTPLQCYPLPSVQCRRLDRPFHMLLLSFPSVVTKAHCSALARQDDICAIISGMQRRRSNAVERGWNQPLHQFRRHLLRHPTPLRDHKWSCDGCQHDGSSLTRA